MNLKTFIKNKLINILVTISVAVISFIVMLVSGVSAVLSVIIFLLFCICFTVCFYFDYKKRLQYYNALKSLKNNNGININPKDIIRINNDGEYTLFSEIIKDLIADKNENIKKIQSKIYKYNEYLNDWSDMTKKSFGVIRQDIKKEKDTDFITLDNHINLLETDICQMIYLYKSMSGVKPILEEVKMKHITMPIMKRHGKMLMSKKINISFKGTDKSIFTNLDYINYIVDCFINSSVNNKASKIKVTSLEDEQSITLIIEDNGIGINGENFDTVQGSDKEKRYNLKQETMELFVCKSLCEYMGHNLFISSGDTTKVEIKFNK